jgi:hypothetical protein
MKGLKKALIFLLIVSLVTVSLYSTGLAQDYLTGMTQDREKWVREDPVGQGWSLMDIVFARPAGVVMGIGGVLVFVVALPFTIPSGGVNDSFNMFVVKPFQFSFTRQFPDGDI